RGGDRARGDLLAATGHHPLRNIAARRRIEELPRAGPDALGNRPWCVREPAERRLEGRHGVVEAANGGDRVEPGKNRRWRAGILRRPPGRIDHETQRRTRRAGRRVLVGDLADPDDDGGPCWIAHFTPPLKTSTRKTEAPDRDQRPLYL